MTNSESPDVEATFTVRGPPAQVSVIRSLLTAIDVLCGAGASRTLEVDVDGDGASSVTVTEDGKPLGARLTEGEEAFYIWPHLHPSTDAETPESLRAYSVCWRVDGRGKRTLVLALDGCGPPHESA